MKIPVRFFSIGLFTAATVLLIIYLITNREATAEDFSVEELSAALEAEGYRAIDQDEYISYTVYLDEMKEKEEQEKNEEKNKTAKAKEKTDENKKEKDNAVKENKEKENEKEKEKEEVKTIKLKIEQGMVSQDIAKKLKDEKLIDDEQKFIKYLEDNGYSSYIQIGTFKLKSDMSIKQIAETITTYPGS